ncbi:MAG: hypothetical protein AAB353_06975 [Candidatus Hydrogenedentota bacterium]
MTMRIEIDSRHQRPLEQLAVSRGQTIDETLDAVIVNGIAAVSKNGGTVETKDWKSKLLRFLDEMNDLPTEGPADGFSGAEHDDILYGPRS